MFTGKILFSQYTSIHYITFHYLLTITSSENHALCTATIHCENYVYDIIVVNLMQIKGLNTFS